MGLYDFTFYDLINRNAICFKEKTAWYEVDDDRTLTFGEYKNTVDRLAQGLEKSGIQRGDRLGVLGKNSLEFFSGIWCGRCGGCHRPADQLATVRRGGCIQLE